MRKILFLLLINIFSLTNKSKANNSFSKILGEDNSKENPLDVLKKRMENINSLAPEDFLVDFKALAPPNDPDEQYQYGAASFFPTGALDPNRNNLIASIKLFNDAHTTDNVKLFVFTGRYFVGYHKTDRIPDEAKRTLYLTDRLNNITQQVQKETGTYIDGPRYTNIFQKDWLETLDSKFTTYKSGATKVIVFFYVESILADTPLQAGLDFKAETNTFTSSSGSKLLKHNIGFLWHNGLELKDWMKLNQQSVKTFFDTNLKRNSYTGLSDASGFKTCTDEIKRVFEAPLDLTKLQILVSTINGLPSSDISLIPYVDREKYINKIAKRELYTLPQTTTIAWRDELDVTAEITKKVVPSEGKSALGKLLLNTPASQADDVLTLLENSKTGSKNYVKFFLDEQGISDSDNYSDYVKAITNLVITSTTHRTKHLTLEKVLSNSIEFYDNSWTLGSGGGFILPYEGTKTYESSTDNDCIVTYKAVLTGKTKITFIPKGVDYDLTQTSYSYFEPVTLHPFDIIRYVDNLTPTEPEGLFSVPASPISDIDKLLGTKFVSALQMRYADENRSEKSFNNITKTAKTGAEIAFAFVSGSEFFIAARNSRYLAALTDFAFATGIPADLALNSPSITSNTTIKSLLVAYTKIYPYVGFGGIAAQLAKGAVLQTAVAVKNALRTQGEAFNGLSRVEAERFRSIFAGLEADAKNLSPADYDIYLKLKVADSYLFARGIKALNSAEWITERTIFWNDWINRCFPERDWNLTNFQTIGKDYNQFRTSNVALDNEMKSLYSSSALAERYLPEVINSGVASPIRITVNQGDKFYKIVPKGSNISGASPYYLSEAEYNWIKANPSQLEQKLGLPLGSVSGGYDVFTITSKVNSNVLFESTIARTEQSARATQNIIYSTTGGRTQSLIINNGDELFWIKSTNPYESLNPYILPKIGN